MKKITLLLILLVSFVAVKAQNPVIVTQPYKFQKYVHVAGSLFADSTLLIGTTTNNPWFSSYKVINMAGDVGLGSIINAHGLSIFRNIYASGLSITNWKHTNSGNGSLLFLSNTNSLNYYTSVFGASNSSAQLINRFSIDSVGHTYLSGLRDTTKTDSLVGYKLGQLYKIPFSGGSSGQATIYTKDSTINNNRNIGLLDRSLIFHGQSVSDSSTFFINHQGFTSTSINISDGRNSYVDNQPDNASLNSLDVSNNYSVLETGSSSNTSTLMASYNLNSNNSKSIQTDVTGGHGIIVTENIDSVGIHLIDTNSYARGLTDTLSLPPLYIVKRLIKAGGGNTIYTGDGTVSDPGGQRTVSVVNNNLQFNLDTNSNFEISSVGDGNGNMQINASSSTNTSNVSLAAAATKGNATLNLTDGIVTLQSTKPLPNNFPKSITINPDLQGILITDQQHGFGLKADSLSIDTSKMTGWVYPTMNKVAAYVASHSGSSYTFSSGLTNDGSGNISLGGNIGNNTADLTIGSTGGFDARTTGTTETNSIGVSNVGANMQNHSTDGESIIGVDGSSNAAAFMSVEDNSGNVSGFTFDMTSLKVLDAQHSRGLLYGSNYTTNQRLNRLSIPSVNTVIALADSVKGTISGGTGTVTSITPGVGFLSHTPITTNGTMNVDTASTIQTIPNFFPKGDTRYQKLSNLQTTLSNSITQYPSGSAVTTALAGKLNITDTSAMLANVVHKALNETITGQKTFSSPQTFSSTINKVTITPPATSSTLTLVTGSTLQTTGAFTLNLTSTANSTPTFPSGSGTLAYLAGGNTWTNNNNFTGLVLLSMGFYTDQSGGSVTSNMRVFAGGALGSPLTNSYMLVDGSTSVSSRVLLTGQDNTQSLSSGGAGFNEYIASSPITLNSGTSPISAAFGVRAPTLTGSGTFTDAATFYSQGAPTGGTATNRWNGWFKYGVSRFTSLQIDTLNANTLLGIDGNKRIVNATYNAIRQTPVVSSASTLTLTYATDYFFTGTTATYTLPAISATALGDSYCITIKNRGSGNITVNAASGSTIYDTSAVSTITVAPGSAIRLNNDGTYLNRE